MENKKKEREREQLRIENCLECLEVARRLNLPNKSREECEKCENAPGIPITQVFTYKPEPEPSRFQRVRRFRLLL